MLCHSHFGSTSFPEVPELVDTDSGGRSRSCPSWLLFRKHRVDTLRGIRDTVLLDGCEHADVQLLFAGFGFPEDRGDQSGFRHSHSGDLVHWVALARCGNTGGSFLSRDICLASYGIQPKRLTREREFS